MYPLSRHYQRLLTTVNRNYGTVSSQRTFMSTMFGSDSVDNKDSPSMSSSTTEISGLVSKADIVEKIAEEHELSKAKSNRIVTQIFDTIAEEVANNKKVTISGFGYFQALDTKQRNGRNPSTGEAIVIPASKRVKFSAYTSLKELVVASK